MACELLFGSDIGLLSLSVIVITTGMSVYYLRFFMKKMNEKPATE